jgi:hypothetical protein
MIASCCPGPALLANADLFLAALRRLENETRRPVALNMDGAVISTRARQRSAMEVFPGAPLQKTRFKKSKYKI